MPFTTLTRRPAVRQQYNINVERPYMAAPVEQGTSPAEPVGIPMARMNRSLEDKALSEHLARRTANRSEFSSIPTETTTSIAPLPPSAYAKPAPVATPQAAPQTSTATSGANSLEEKGYIRFGRGSVYNPKTKHFIGFAEDYSQIGNLDEGQIQPPTIDPKTVANDTMPNYGAMRERNAQIVAAADAQARQSQINTGTYLPQDPILANQIAKAKLTMGDTAGFNAMKKEWDQRHQKPAELPPFEMTPEIAAKYANLPQYTESEASRQSRLKAAADYYANRANVNSGGYFQNKAMEEDANKRANQESQSKSDLNTSRGNAETTNAEANKTTAEAKAKAAEDATAATAKENADLKKQLQDMQKRYDAIEKKLADIASRADRQQAQTAQQGPYYKGQTARNSNGDVVVYDGQNWVRREGV